jgi:hypothetical protein
MDGWMVNMNIHTKDIGEVLRAGFGPAWCFWFPNFRLLGRRSLGMSSIQVTFS